MQNQQTINIFAPMLGNKQFELTNHLGNVMVTLSDMKIAHNNGGTIDYYNASVTSATDYFPGGMPLPNRSYSPTEYKYGHNGQLKDDDIYGNGNAYTAEYWEYDSRLIRRWNRDPITKPWESPYACFDGNPIYFADPSGAEGETPQPTTGTWETHNDKGYTGQTAPPIELKEITITPTPSTTPAPNNPTPDNSTSSGNSTPATTTPDSSTPSSTTGSGNASTASSKTLDNSHSNNNSLKSTNNWDKLDVVHKFKSQKYKWDCCIQSRKNLASVGVTALPGYANGIQIANKSNDKFVPNKNYIMGISYMEHQLAMGHPVVVGCATGPHYEQYKDKLGNPFQDWVNHYFTVVDMNIDENGTVSFTFYDQGNPLIAGHKYTLTKGADGIYSSKQTFYQDNIHVYKLLWINKNVSATP